MNQDGHDEDSQQQPCTADGGARNEQKDAAKDLSPSQQQADESWHMRRSKAVGAARHHEEHGFDKDDDAEGPLQNGETDFGFYETHGRLAFFELLFFAF